MYSPSSLPQDGDLVTHFDSTVSGASDCGDDAVSPDGDGSARWGVFDRTDEEDEEIEGFESGYESDPVERFFVVRKWQRQLSSIQRRLQRGLTERVSRKGSAGEQKSEFSPLGQQKGKVIDALQEIRKRSRRLRESTVKVSGTLRERQREIGKKYGKQMDELRGKMDQVLAKARYAKMRQIRHMTCFCMSMVDVVVTSFWLGASPLTFHWYYTFKCASLIGCRAVWYRWHGLHYFLFDLCYISNALLLIYMWFLPSSTFLFSGMFGFSGVLLISIPLFRNSFVPHSLDRVTSLQVHLSPVLQLWVVRWLHSDSQYFVVSDTSTVLPSLGLYFMWAFIYILHQFVFGRKHIERKGYLTLFQHMAINMGLLKRLPKTLQGPCASRLVFMLGHFSLFAAGLPYVYLPRVVQMVLICGCVVWTFKNGAAFYITYFWKVYDSQINSFERQMKAASAQAAAQPSTEEADEDHCNDEPCVEGGDETCGEGDGGGDFSHVDAGKGRAVKLD